MPKIPAKHMDSAEIGREVDEINRGWMSLRSGPENKGVPDEETVLRMVEMTDRLDELESELASRASLEAESPGSRF